MRTCLAFTGLLACFFSYASATALTYKLTANEKACFFSNVEQQGAKIAFYFAVSLFILAHSVYMLYLGVRPAERYPLPLGPIWWLLRRRLHRYRPRWEDHHGELKRAAARLRLHGQDNWRIQLLFQQ